MISPEPQHSRILTGIAPVLSVLLVCPFLCLSAAAQSASSFNTSSFGGSPQPAEPAPAEKPTAPGLAPSTPSRLVSREDLDGYVKGLVGIFSMQSRETDPFGRSQDPNAKPVVPVSPANNGRRPAPAPVVSLSEIVRLIVVNTIMPGEKQFLVGTRSFKQGDQIPLVFRNQQLRIEVTEVNSQQIVFRNVANGEMATRKLDVLPVGMTPGTHGIVAPGMMSGREDNPIDLDSGEAAP